MIPRTSPPMAMQPQQMAPQNGRPANMRPGDWMCPSCNNHNYADKIRCNRCKMPKADSFDPFAMRQANAAPPLELGEG